MAASNNDLQLFSLGYAKVILKVLYKRVFGNMNFNADETQMGVSVSVELSVSL